MKVRIFGFDWSLGDWISADDFCAHLATFSGMNINNRILSLCKTDKYWTGLLLSIKDVRAYCKIENDGERFTIKAQELDDNTNIVDFNFFLFNPLTRRGLYQHYHQSASANTFCNLCKKQYNELKKNRKNEEIERIGGDSARTKDLKKISQKYNGVFRFSTLVKPDTFEEYVRQMKKIKKFAYEVSTISANKKELTALGGFADRQTHIFYFTGEAVNAHKIKDEIYKLDPTNRLRKATVEGTDHDDEDAMYRLRNDYESYVEYDYDEVVRTVSIDSNDLISSIKESSLTEILIDLATKDRQLKQLINKRIR